MILTWLIIIPAIGGVLAWLIGHRSAIGARIVALVASAADLGLSLYLWSIFPKTFSHGSRFIDHLVPSVFMQQRVPWIPQLGVSYHLAIDGLSLLLIMLTTVIGVIAVLSSWRDITDRIAEFHFALMILISAIIGAFLAFDLLLFYLFWELMLIPMYFLISIWGHENRRYAAIKFILFTLTGGFLLLIGILGLYVMHGRATGIYTFDYAALLGTPMSASVAFWLMLGFFVGLAVKLPIVPLHTWLPDAHTQAPTTGSLVLAALMLKVGAYGFMRFSIPLFPAASATLAVAAMIIGVVGIIYGAVLAYPQRDFKRLVAYTSVSHMGFVILGIYAGNQIAIQGAVMAILAHGFSTGALFLISGMLQERTHTRDFRNLGGLWSTTPKLGGFTLFFALAALGLPGLANFVGEFLVLLGTFQVAPVIAAIGALGFVLSVIYALRLVQDSVQGPNTNNWTLPDLSPREVAILGSLAALIIWLGLNPQPVFNTARNSLIPITNALQSAGAREARNPE